MAMLEVKNLGISFGGLRAVNGFNITIQEGELYGLIGPNGAGKTTVFNLLTGVYKPNEGIIKLDGEDITGKKTIDINKAGIARNIPRISVCSSSLRCWTTSRRGCTIIILFHADRDFPPSQVLEDGKGNE